MQATPTPAQDTYRRKLESLPGVHRIVDTPYDQAGAVRYATHDMHGKHTANIVVSPEGHVVGAWDPDRLTEAVKGLSS